MRGFGPKDIIESFIVIAFVVFFLIKNQKPRTAFPLERRSNNSLLYTCALQLNSVVNVVRRIHYLQTSKTQSILARFWSIFNFVQNESSYVSGAIQCIISLRISPFRDCNVTQFFFGKSQQCGIRYNIILACM